MTITMIKAIQAHNEAAPPEFRTICRDLTIDTKGVGPIRIVDFVRNNEHIIGDVFASWTILAERTAPHHPYVVWILVARPNGWLLESGTYCDGLSDAELAFARRTGVRA